MLKAVVVQVLSLQAQATEHRMIKEKLQAAVAAALGDAVNEACPTQLPSTAGQHKGSDTAGMGSGSADDLQHAISSLKVCLTSHKTTLAVTAYDNFMPLRDEA